MLDRVGWRHQDVCKYSLWWWGKVTLSVWNPWTNKHMKVFWTRGLGLNSFSVLIFLPLFCATDSTSNSTIFRHYSGALLSVRRLNRGGNNQLWHVWNPWRTFCTRLDSRGELCYCGLWFSPLRQILSNIVYYIRRFFTEKWKMFLTES